MIFEVKISLYLTWVTAIR